MKVVPIIDYAAVSRLHSQRKLASLLIGWKKRVNVSLSQIPQSVSVTVAHEKALVMIDELRKTQSGTLQIPLRAVLILGERSDIDISSLDPLYLSSLASSLDVPIISDSEELPGGVKFETWVGLECRTLYVSTNPSLAIQAVITPSPETRYFQGVNYLILVRAAHTMPIVSSVMEGEDILICISLSSPSNTICVACATQTSSLLVLERVKKHNPLCVVVCEGNDIWYDKDGKTFHGSTYDKCSMLSQMYDGIISSSSLSQKMGCEHRTPQLKTHPHDVFYIDRWKVEHITNTNAKTDVDIEGRLTKIETMLADITKLITPPRSPFSIEAKPTSQVQIPRSTLPFPIQMPFEIK